MLGTDCEPGIYIRILDDLFKALEATTEEMDYRVSMSYLEVKCLCCPGPKLCGNSASPWEQAKWEVGCPSLSIVRSPWAVQLELSLLPFYPKEIQEQLNLLCRSKVSMLISHQPLDSCPQIYNEVIRDLLNPSSGFLDLREDSRGSIQIAGITEVSTTNAQEVPGATVHGEEKGRGIVLACNSVLKFLDAFPLPVPYSVARTLCSRTSVELD